MIISGKPCKEFAGYRNSKGYGNKHHKGKTQLAHRVAYAEHHGIAIEDVPPLLRHKCDNPACCEPLHLEPGTHLDNERDKVERGRKPKGEQAYQAKLTDAQVAAIRERFVPRCKINGQRAMAREFGVSQPAISFIINGRNWQ